MATPIPINQCEFTLAEVVEATGGKLVRASTAPAVESAPRRQHRHALDSSRVQYSSRCDGAAQTVTTILQQAAARGAAAAIVATGRHHPALDCIEVGDTLDALGRLAHRHLARTRAARALPLIAIGGAVGKTTTKELTAAVVRAIFGSTLSTPGNLNNLIGVPMTIFTLTGEHRAAVLECGTNTRGEIPKLAQIVVPDVAMVLNVDLEHSEGLGTLDDIADEEAALFSTATPLRGRFRRRADGPGADSETSAPNHLRQICRRPRAARQSKRRRPLAHPRRNCARHGRQWSRTLHRN